jgi:hypothetical protein
MWSLVQQLSYQRLSVSTGELKGKLVQSYAVRARRISGTYARFYLEQEEGGDLSKKGRFYWMALGAFASKTVACTLEAWQVRMQAAAIDTTKEGLGKGNFWLFCDISAWHWYYSIYPRTFEKCLESRNAKNYVPTVKAQMAKLPWQAAALPKIKQMVVSEHIKTGFAKVKEFEESTNTIRARDAQLKHLLAIADHEQGVILQPLIYEDADFVFWLKLQRSAWVNWASPNLELAFSSACKTDDEKLKSVAPEGMKLEDLQNRMDWIGKAAKNFHRLMTTQKSYMESQLAIMASWHANLDE